jgi:GTP-binding protein EngB required for normal cell division
MDDPRQDGTLNSAQRQHLLSSCEYADKLLSEIEAILAAAQAKSPFPKFQPDISAQQAKVVQDYVARMRAQMVRILESQGVPIPAPGLGSIHSIRVTLGFADIAFEECRPKRMAGYGEVPEAARTELSGVVDEMQGIIARVDAYLAQGQKAGLDQRLERLEEAGGGVALVKVLERVINRHGLVEFRPALAAIIERLESKSFEIAVIGRVSSGKSSLLNYIAGQDVLPVGVNPVTAVPTRLVYGTEPGATAWFADRKPEHFGVNQLAEFVTEQQNPSNVRHITRIVVTLPAARLREGVVFVDTPGLGSLATSGAAETRAYLPRCDLGVVLVDAGSTLMQDDLATIQKLYDAGVPVSVLLSKADILLPAELARVREYVSRQIQSGLGLELPVHAVSVKAGYTGLLENWLNAEIIPLYDRHAELARQSVNRKIGALRLGVAAALSARLKRRNQPMRIEPVKLRELESDLRTAAGKIAEARTRCIDMTDTLRECAGEFVQAAAESVIETWQSTGDPATGKGLVITGLERAAAQRASQIADAISDAALNAGRVLAKAGQTLGFDNRPEPDELNEMVRDMPRFDLGALEIEVAPSAASFLLGRRWAVRRLLRQNRSPAGGQIEAAVEIYARVVLSWVRKTFTELQERFDSYAGAYRAQLGRLASSDAADDADGEALGKDLAALNTATLPGATAQEPSGAAA